MSNEPLSAGGTRGAVLLAAALMAAAGVARAGEGPLHVPSPDWRDQVIYFAMIDRFDDGEPANNDQGAGEYDPADDARYSGGDLRGVARRLDYIQGLGATAVWLTPQVANQWLNPRGTYAGYHGYWASDFSAVDAHYGTAEDYRALARALHGRGMYLVQDVVVNHVGDWLQCDAGALEDGGEPAATCSVRTDPAGRSAPVQSPFDRNDPRDPDHLAAGIYHWLPDITDFTDRRQELDYQLAGLDDLDTGNAEVRRALRATYGAWIRDTGVDAFRIDTAYHVPADYFVDFMASRDPQAPGMSEVARATGRQDFLAFGEGFGSDRPLDDRLARKLDAYMREPGGLDSMINFPLYGSLGDVFARGRPTGDLAYRIASMLRLHAAPHRMPTFIDNHDVDRFLAGAGEPALRQALLALMTLPGIPVIYYGTEQGFTRPRAAMFAAGAGSGGRDHFDTAAPLYRYLQRAIALRREHRLFSRGMPTVLASNAAAPGALAWRTDHGNDRAIVVFNTADAETLLDNMDTGLPAGTRLRGLFAAHGSPDDLTVGEGGRVTLVLPPRSGAAWLAMPGRASGVASTAGPTLDALDGPLATGDFEVRGTAPAATRALRLVVDGDLGNAPVVTVDRSGRWRARVGTGSMTAPDVDHRVVAWDAEAGVASAARQFRVRHAWRLVADVADPRGDDHGPAGTYRYPTRSDWAQVRPADIERVRAWEASGALRIEVTLPAISTVWNPTNGFDRVAFSAFMQLPGVEGGVAEMPGQNARLPEGMRWNLRLRAHGWSNALFAADGAGPDADGRPVTPVADLEVDREARTVTFTLPASVLGNRDSLAGARLYVTTWDYDGGYRALAAEAGEGHFGGGDGARDPLWMDASDVIELR